MGFELINTSGVGTEGAQRGHIQKEIDLQLASAGLVGGNMGLTTGGSAGTETGISDAVDANELRLRGSAMVDSGLTATSTQQQRYWRPA